MLLLPDGKELTQGDLLQQVLQCPLLQQSCAQFLERQGAAREGHHLGKRLCVLQGEEALVKFDSSNNIDGHVLLGSVDATTCVIAVAICRRTRLAWAAHYDEDTTAFEQHEVVSSEDGSCSDSEPDSEGEEDAAEDSSESKQRRTHEREAHESPGGTRRAAGAETLGPLPSALLAEMQEPELYLVGGYDDDRASKPLGRHVCSSLLAALQRCGLRLLLRLACLHAANSDPATGAPRAVCLSVSTACGTPYPSPTLLPHGPELSRRLAYPMFKPRSTALLSIYDAVRDEIVLPGFGAQLPRYYLQYLKQLLELPDEQFLLQCSTSPLHEPPNFVDDIKSYKRWVIRMQASPNIPEVRYAWRPDSSLKPFGGEWVPTHLLLPHAAATSSPTAGISPSAAAGGGGGGGGDGAGAACVMSMTGHQALVGNAGGGSSSAAALVGASAAL